jgi:hypothetical protein
VRDRPLAVLPASTRLVLRSGSREDRALSCELVATADFNGDNKPDYVLYNGGTRQTAIWYLNNNLYAGSAWGPTLRVGWSLVAP